MIHSESFLKGFQLFCHVYVILIATVGYMLGAYTHLSPICTGASLIGSCFLELVESKFSESEHENSSVEKIKIYSILYIVTPPFLVIETVPTAQGPFFIPGRAPQPQYFVDAVGRGNTTS